LDRGLSPVWNCLPRRRAHRKSARPWEDELMFENGPAEAAERDAPTGRDAGSLAEGVQRHHTKVI
jgi:hypothetical protein